MTATTTDWFRALTKKERKVLLTALHAHRRTLLAAVAQEDEFAMIEALLQHLERDEKS